ncbi:uncharacterized protein LOC121711370 isoform X1 [Alosa sapidissima]|uniref:uncharacterized protein LOC121711370 isoform X1 n=2 Tax=Alosa sapidissima TaxID=34773 RepID=UPI001C08D337|nr:uncharacterized protein LOC121711370 isoform X1 [Alosa sapidissima]
MYISLTLHLIVILTGDIHCNDFREVKVKRGGTVTLHCDIIRTTGSHINWFRNCAHSYQPALVISPTMLREHPMERFTFVKRGHESYNLRISNVTPADLGTYYCANTEKKDGQEHYIYGKTFTRVVLTGNGLDECEEIKTPTDCSACPQQGPFSSPGPPLALGSECGQCWMMIYSGGVVCILLVGILITVCISHICLKKDHQKEVEFYSHGSQFKAHELSKEHRCWSSVRGQPCLHTEVIYRPLGSSHTRLDE